MKSQLHDFLRNFAGEGKVNKRIEIILAKILCCFSNSPFYLISS